MTIRTEDIDFTAVARACLPGLEPRVRALLPDGRRGGSRVGGAQSAPE